MKDASKLSCLIAGPVMSCSLHAQDKPLKKFRWGVTSLSASQWIPWIAKDAKLYEKYGLEAELVCCADRGNRRRRSSATAFSALPAR